MVLFAGDRKWQLNRYKKFSATPGKNIQRKCQLIVRWKEDAAGHEIVVYAISKGLE